MRAYRLGDDDRFRLAAYRLNIRCCELYWHLVRLQYGIVSRRSRSYRSDEAFEIIAEWTGERGALVRVLCDVGLVRRLDSGAIELLYSIRERVVSGDSRESSKPSRTTRSIPRPVPDVNPLQASVRQLITQIASLETEMHPHAARQYWRSRLRQLWPDGEIPVEFRGDVLYALRAASGKAKCTPDFNPARWLNARLKYYERQKNNNAQN